MNNNKSNCNHSEIVCDFLRDRQNVRYPRFIVGATGPTGPTGTY